MTVKELKKILRGVPDHVEVTALKDGVYCEETNVWGARYDIDEDEDTGDPVERFIINC
jgi:hypothetical protein